MSYTARLEYESIIKDFGIFSNVHDCLNFINTNEKMIIINYLFHRLDYQLMNYHFIESSYIRVYDLSQKRYCDGFDF